MRLVDKALSVNLVNIFRTRWAEGKPAVFSNDFQAADGGIVAWSIGQDSLDRFASQGILFDRIWSKILENVLLLHCCRGINAGIDGRTKAIGEFLVMDSWITSCLSGDLGSQKVKDDPVLVSTPDRAVLTEKTGPGTLFSAKEYRPVEQAVNKPLEAHRYFHHLSVQLCCHPVND